MGYRGTEVAPWLWCWRAWVGATPLDLGGDPAMPMDPCIPANLLRQKLPPTYFILQPCKFSRFSTSPSPAAKHTGRMGKRKLGALEKVEADLSVLSCAVSDL
jgi:hypothetical protein